MGTAGTTLRFAEITRLEHQLLDIPRLVDQYERNDALFASNVKSWLKTVEDALMAIHNPAASQIATFRASVVTAERKREDPDTHRRLRSKDRSQLIITALRNAESVVSSLLVIPASRLQESREICRQMLALAQFRGVVSSRSAGEDREQFIARLWKQLSSEPELAMAGSKLVSVVGTRDVTRILDSVVDDVL